MKKISDYIVTFAFLYSSFLCFDRAIDLWLIKKHISIMLFLFGAFSFIAVFRFSIARFIYFIRDRFFKNEKR